MAVATATIVVDRVGPSAERDASGGASRSAYQARLEELAGRARPARRRGPLGAGPLPGRDGADQPAADGDPAVGRGAARALHRARPDARSGCRMPSASATRWPSANDRLLAQMNEVSASLTSADLRRRPRRRRSRPSRARSPRRWRPATSRTTERADADRSSSPSSSSGSKMNSRAPGRDGRPARAGDRAVVRAAREAVQEDRPRRRQPDRHGAQHLFRPGRPARRGHGLAPARSTTPRSAPASTG